MLPGVFDLGGANVVRFLEQGNLLSGDFPHDAHGQAGPGERLAVHDLRGQAEVASNDAHLILEQLAQGLDEFHLEVFGQTANVVVALDHGGVAPVYVDRLDHIRVERSLTEEVGVLEGLGLLAEDLHELVADDLALLFGVGDAG